MTDITSAGVARSVHTTDAAKSRLARRYAAERRFRFFGLIAVGISTLFLALLLWSIGTKSFGAFTQNSLTLEIELAATDFDNAAGDKQAAITSANFNGIVRQALRAQFPHVSGRKNKRALAKLLSVGAPYAVQRDVAVDPSLIGGTHWFDMPLSDTADLYLKGRISPKSTFEGRGIASLVVEDKTVRVLSTSNDFAPILAEIKAEIDKEASMRRGEAAAKGRSVAQHTLAIDTTLRQLKDARPTEIETLTKRLEGLQADIEVVRSDVERLTDEAGALESRAGTADAPEKVSDKFPSYLVRINGGIIKVSSISATGIAGEALHPIGSSNDAPGGTWDVLKIVRPQGIRKISDKQIVWLDHLVERGLVEAAFNVPFFTSGASREAELAGIWGAAVGSFYALLVTLALSFPLGVAAAIYLEEFAPKNRWTEVIEVNINNLAAVPSIVFGLLGLAIFLNVFGLPRSAPLVGGMVLALMTLPTIIIASRAALRAVPPSIRQAALGVGASRVQAVFHHVLPLAMPGILTGTIIGMAQALGETAPLLMIGMVAFIVDIPGGLLDPATVLPVQIYMWADFPEPAFEQKTAAAILVLLGFLIIMNAIAVVLRKRFERRW